MKSERGGRVCPARLREALLGYFERAMRLPIPGGDGLTLDDAPFAPPLCVNRQQKRRSKMTIRSRNRIRIKSKSTRRTRLSLRHHA